LEQIDLSSIAVVRGSVRSAFFFSSFRSNGSSC